MRARALSFATNECVSVLLGGLSYQKATPEVINIIHIYVFLLFCFIPYMLMQTFDGESAALWVYCGVMGAIFSVVKTGNHVLHMLLSKSSPVSSNDGPVITR